MLPLSVLAGSALLLSSVPSSQAAYSLVTTHAGSSFFDGWNFYGNYDNLTNGDITFVNQTDSTDLAYLNDAGNIVIKVDNVSTVPYNEKRRSVRIEGTQEYGIGSLIVFDALHTPYGPSVWPAFWMLSKQWPEGGEIDIFEGVNLQSVNQMALHTTSGCTAANTTTSDPYTGQLQYNNCDTTVNGNSGCTVTEPNQASYGEAFSTAGGGVWAADFGKDGIDIYFFSRDSVPSDLLATNTSAIPDPTTWGTPSASYGNASCSIADHFAPLHMVLDITACGDWAGASSVLASTGAPIASNSTCYLSYVLNSTNYDTAYFEIASVRAYFDSDKAANSSAATTATTTTTASTAGSVPSSTSTAKSTSGASKLSFQSLAGLVALAVGGWAIL